MNDIAIFALGAIVFGGYMYGLLSMINSQHKIQARQQTNHEKGLASKAAERAPVEEQ